MTDPKPMLCHTAPGKPPELPTGEGWILEPKHDGWRFLIRVDEDSVRAYGGRNGRDHSGQAPKVEQQLLAVLPAGTLLDGEMVVLGQPSSSVSSALSRPKYGRPVFIAFDLLEVAGHDIRGLPWSDRRKLLEKACEGFDGEHVRLSEVLPATQAEYERLVAEGYEGAVVKRVTSRYRPGKRSWDWMKLKPQATAEAKIVGFERGKGASNADRWGAVVFEMLDGGAVSSCGMSALIEEQALADPQSLVGRTIELWHMGIFDSGKPRHPIFKQLRPDRDCC